MSYWNRVRPLAIAILIVFVAIGCKSSPQSRERKFLGAGKALLAKKEFARASLEFRNAVQAMPADPEAYYQLGVSYLGSGRLVEAAGSFKKAIDLNPGYSDAQLKLAAIMTATRNQDLLEAARERLEGLIAGGYGNTEVLGTLARAELLLGKQESAVDRLNQVLDRLPASLQSSVTLARFKVGQGDWAGAEEILKKAVAAAPNSSLAAVALGQFYLLRHQPEQAEAEVRRALRMEPSSPAALTTLATLQIAGNRLDEAGQTYRLLSALPEKSFRPAHAVFLLQTGHGAAAVSEFEQLAKDDPNDRDARSRLAAAYLAMNRTADAEGLYASALKKNPKDIDALLESNELRMHLGRPPRPDELQRVLSLAPKAPAAHLAMAGAYRAQGLGQSERQELTEALNLDPELAPARAALAANLLASNQAEAALKILDQAPVAQRKLLSIVLQRNWVLLALGRLDELKSGINQALATRRPPEAVLQEALLRIARKDYAGARETAEELLGNNPENIRAAYIVVQSDAAQKDLPKGLERLRALVAARPDSAPLRQLLGQWYAESGDSGQARKSFEAANRMDPKFTQALMALAELDLRENRPEPARQRLQAILSVEPKNVNAMLRLAAAEDRRGNRAGAIAQSRSALDTDSVNTVALNNLAFYLVPGDLEQALQYARRAVELDPRNNGAKDTLGWIYYRKGRYREAVGQLKAVMEQSPTPEHQFHLGLAYLGAGETQLGQRTVQAALRERPDLGKTEQGWLVGR